MSNQILKVGQSKDKAQLTKGQKEFNRLTKRITKLRLEMQLVEEVKDRLHQRFVTIMLPLQQKYAAFRADMVRLFDKAHRNGSFKSQERKKLEELILTMSFNLILDDGIEELKEIYDRYSDSSYDEELAEIEAEDADKMKAMMAEMFGLDPDDEELRSPERMRAFFERQMAEEDADLQERWRQQEERRAKRPKTDRQLEKEREKDEEERKISKSVREVYLELAKSFHPDLEPDENEKQRKTEVMQRIAEAYENNDLLSLLQLQLEFEQIDQDHLENIAEERLQHFTKILRRQATELEAALYEAQGRLAQTSGQSWELPPLYQETLFERDIKELRKELRELEKDLQQLSEPGYLKMWLKEL